MNGLDGHFSKGGSNEAWWKGRTLEIVEGGRKHLEMEIVRLLAQPGDTNRDEVETLFRRLERRANLSVASEQTVPPTSPGGTRT